ncbi:hypothetical protein ACN23B_08360 [Anabaena sp. FACHB-709]|uniref:PIN domain-containing protein n=2 Tax=Nostocaceae TaxID=1162 RepID=A0A1Z4KE97_ANAVA|nr:MULTISPECIES: hypothetical protein [Nostocaceae]BAY67292.1 hypothetical protein NIES23_00640 [Trichormus variabilis NIES-23]HBW30387.1 hypothetical protein [Nostoc sp. UBA8866]MBD2173134.1 hypothetical protein [Anabaena cylindrica FACHB-318]MBD2264877.1 hypothetical protein [Anabaena sp. FACHB-709]MBD2274058.1 hypothetical protein [Nostoc sp. PCC 7120 = FACHB-418]
MFKILFDSDLILDAVMNRTELAEDVRTLLENLHPSIRLYLTDVGLQKVSTYTYCLKNSQIPEIIVDWLQEQIQICPIDQGLLQKARYSPLRDFESAVELACINHYQLNAIVTNKPEDFIVTAHPLCVWSFADLWLRVNLESQLQATIHS